MTDTQKTPSDYEALIDIRERNLISQQNQISRFLNTSHKGKETKKFYALVRASEIEMNDMLRELLKLKEGSSEFQSEALNLGQRVRELKKLYISEMKSDLANDLLELHHQKKDYVKNVTFLFGLPASFFLVVKNGLFSGTVTPEQAAKLGLLLSSSVVCLEKIKDAFRATGQSLCQAPKKIREEVKSNFTFFYVRETLKNRAGKYRRLEP